MNVPLHGALGNLFRFDSAAAHPRDNRLDSSVAQSYRIAFVELRRERYQTRSPAREFPPLGIRAMSCKHHAQRFRLTSGRWWSRRRSCHSLDRAAGHKRTTASSDFAGHARGSPAPALIRSLANVAWIPSPGGSGQRHLPSTIGTPGQS
jgi:hypothetical protein